MLKSITSSDARFKAVSFKPGLNLFVATKTEKSSSRNTRNGSGKSSLVEILSYMLAGNAEPGCIFKLKEFEETCFTLKLTLNESEVAVSRCGGNSRFYIEAQPSLPISLETDDQTGRTFLSLTKWKQLLGDAFFGLGPVTSSRGKNGPSMRSLLSYFLRREAEGAFSEAEKHYKNQQTGDYQVNLSYLFDLDWHIAQDWQNVRDIEKSVDALRKALKQGALGGEVIENAGTLRTQLTIAEKSLSDLQDRREHFRVAEDYRAIEAKASELTRLMNDLADGNTMDELVLAALEESLSKEVPPPKLDVERVYKAAGLELGGTVLKKFEEVTQFHESVIRNRREFLEAEIETTKVRLAKRREEQRRIDKELAGFMAVLRSSGALDQYSALQDDVSKVAAAVNMLREKYELARQLESKQADMSIKRGQLLAHLQRDLDERDTSIRNAILTFEAISEELYEDPGSLTIEPTDNGPEFGTIIHAKRSKGKNHMQIFCFDMTLAILNAGKRMPGFLVHDSHLFDGADERQIARALKIGAEAAEKYGFQYIVTMNSDDMPSPRELPEGFELEPHINPLQITDASEDGGLFGFRFS